MTELLDYERLISTGLDIIDKEGVRRPFELNPVQRKYLATLTGEYINMQGLRENIVKARQEGFSAIIDAMLLFDFLLIPNTGGQIISHKEKETEVLMRRVNFFLNSFLEKKGLKRSDVLSTDRMDYLENKTNGSYLFIGTAGAKTLGRGGTLQNIHWSEVGYYPNTQIINAERLVNGAEQQVAMNVGKIFRESTGNMVGDYFYKEVERARKGESSFKLRFYAWFEDPTYELPVNQMDGFAPTVEERQMMDKYDLNVGQIAWYRRKSQEFETRALFLRDYPTTLEEAFVAGGSTYYDPDTLKFYKDNARLPIQQGNLAMDGGWI